MSLFMAQVSCMSLASVNNMHKNIPQLHCCYMALHWKQGRVKSHSFQSYLEMAAICYFIYFIIFCLVCKHRHCIYTLTFCSHQTSFHIKIFFSIFKQCCTVDIKNSWQEHKYMHIKSFLILKTTWKRYVEVLFGSDRDGDDIIPSTMVKTRVSGCNVKMWAFNLTYWKSF